MKGILFFLLVIFMALPISSHAEEVTKGYLHKGGDTSFTVELKSGAMRRFIAADDIHVMSESGQLKMKDIPKHSKVQVVERHGLAELVIVEEMPR